MAKLKDIKLVSPGKYLSKYEFSYETRDGGEKQYEMVSNNRAVSYTHLCNPRRHPGSSP